MHHFSYVYVVEYVIILNQVGTYTFWYFMKWQCVVVLQTIENTLDATESLKKMQDQLHCSDDMLKQWVVDVKQWASSGKDNVIVYINTVGVIGL